MVNRLLCLEGGWGFLPRSFSGWVRSIPGPLLRRARAETLGGAPVSSPSAHHGQHVSHVPVAVGEAPFFKGDRGHSTARAFFAFPCFFSCRCLTLCLCWFGSHASPHRWHHPPLTSGAVLVHQGVRHDP